MFAGDSLIPGADTRGAAYAAETSNVACVWARDVVDAVAKSDAGSLSPVEVGFSEKVRAIVAGRVCARHNPWGK
jgi:hypothetical protein